MTTSPPSEPLLFWRYIASSLDRLVALLDGLSADDLDWRPPAPGANSLYVLAMHTLGNAEENLLEILGGQPIGRDREAEFAVQGARRGRARRAGRGCGLAWPRRWRISRPVLWTPLTLTHAGGRLPGATC